jgi:hypothetical protein
MLCSLAEEIALTWNKKLAGSSKMCVCICHIILHHSYLRSHCCAESRYHRTLSLHRTQYLKEKYISPAQVIFLLCLFQPTSCQSFFISLCASCQGMRTLWIFRRRLLPSSLLKHWEWYTERQVIEGQRSVCHLLITISRKYVKEEHKYCRFWED